MYRVSQMFSFFNHNFLVLLTMEPSQEPSFQVAKKILMPKFRALRGVYVRLGWEQKEIDGNKMILMGY
jgi:hypothetical protein